MSTMCGYCFDIKSMSNQLNTLDIDTISTMCRYCFDIESISDQMNTLDIDSISPMCGYCFDIKSISSEMNTLDIDEILYRQCVDTLCRRYSMSASACREKHMENLQYVKWLDTNKSGTQGVVSFPCAVRKVEPGDLLLFCLCHLLMPCPRPEIPHSAQEHLGVRGTCWAWAPA